jgi:hypothetical protein
LGESSYRTIWILFGKLKSLDELNKFIEDPFLFEWARRNIEEDTKLDWGRVDNIIDRLKPWLNLDLYKANQEHEEKQKQAPKIRHTFFDDLTKMGVDIKDIRDLKNKKGYD